MEISIKLNDENSKRLSALKEGGIIDLDLDNICNDAIREQLNNAEKIFSELSDHFEHR